MPHAEHLCNHDNVIDDEKGGCSVCVKCGLVLEEKLFVSNFNEICFEKSFENRNFEAEGEIRDIVSIYRIRTQIK